MSCLLTAVAWGSVAVVMTELLSVLGLLSPLPLRVCWASVLAVLLVRTRSDGGFRALAQDVRGMRRRLRESRPPLMVRGVVAIALVCLVVALAAPPNTVDGLTYHMPRVMHWMQNQSLSPFSTNNARQLHMTPGAEYLILHLQLLSGGDRFANCVQWAGMSVSLVGVSLIARTLGASASGQALASLLCATIPMGILQSTSTQNDYAAAAWIVCFVAFGMELTLRPAVAPDAGKQRSLALVLAMGASIGLALLTKATAFIILPPFVAWLGVLMLAKFGRQGIVSAGIMAAVALLLNAGFFARNIQANGRMLGPGAEDVGGVIHRYENAQVDLRVVASNVIRNAALAVQLPWAEANARIEAIVRRLHSVIGADWNDPRTTLIDTSFALQAGDNEDMAQAIVMLLAFAAAMASLHSVARPARRRIICFVACVVIAFVMFCAYLKWQPWHSRLHLPLLVLMSSAIAVIADLSWPRLATRALAGIAVLASAHVLVFNPTRPLLGDMSVLTRPRADQYFARAAIWQPAMDRAARQLAERGCRQIAVSMTHDDPEYLLWVTVQPRLPDARFRQVDVTNYSKAFEARERGGDDCGRVTIKPKVATVTVSFPQPPAPASRQSASP